ncbi:MAG: hypothetical protein ACRDD8_03930 [Bacteroidales bacterium]
MSNKDVLVMLLCTYGYDRNIKITTQKEDFGSVYYDIYAENENGDVYEETSAEGVMYHIYSILEYMKERDVSFKSEWWGIPTSKVTNTQTRESLVASWDKRNKEHAALIERNKPLTEWIVKNNPCPDCKINKKTHWDTVHYNCEGCHTNTCPTLKEYRNNYDLFRKEFSKKIAELQ